MTAAIELLQLEIAKCESIREVLQEGHPRIMRLNERIAELKESIHKLQENAEVRHGAKDADPN